MISEYVTKPRCFPFSISSATFSGANAVLRLFEGLKEDGMVNRRVKEKIDGVTSILKQDTELGVEKAIGELSAMNSSDISSYERTQLWSAISLLEGCTRK